MMARKPVDRERLAAFADGELTPEEAAEVVMHLADHPPDQAFVDEVMAANAALARAFAAPMSQPVPDAIRATILGDAARPGAKASVLPFRRKAAPGPRIGGGPALAASVAASVAALGLCVWQGPSGRFEPETFVPGPLAAGSALHAAISRQPSGQAVAVGAAELMILASLPVAGGHCREAELIDRAAQTLTLALVCDQGSGWQVQVALSEPLPAAQPDAASGFGPAGGIETGALDLWLDRLDAGLTLSPADEALAIERAWSLRWRPAPVQLLRFT